MSNPGLFRTVDIDTLPIEKVPEKVFCSTASTFVHSGYSGVERVGDCLLDRAKVEMLLASSVRLYKALKGLIWHLSAL